MGGVLQGSVLGPIMFVFISNTWLDTSHTPTIPIDVLKNAYLYRYIPCLLKKNLSYPSLHVILLLDQRYCDIADIVQESRDQDAACHAEVAKYMKIKYFCSQGNHEKT